MFEFVEREKVNDAIALLCRAGCFHQRLRRLACPGAITTCSGHAESQQTCGAPRIHAELKAAGVGRGRKRVARLMQAAKLVGCHRRRQVVTTVREPVAPVALDRVERQFMATAPNVLRAADITYVPTWKGFLYLAVVFDVFSRRIVGWTVADHLRTELVVAALDMALWNRHPERGVIHHSDHGCQYTSIAFGQHCQEAGVQPSMGLVGDCYDNAITEPFFATFECELLDRQTFRTQEEARTTIFEFIEGFYNTHRRHSALGYLSPAAFERQGIQEAAA